MTKSDEELLFASLPVHMARAAGPRLASDLGRMRAYQ